MKDYIRKADIILFIVLVVTGLAASAALSMSRIDAGVGAKVIIESGGKVFASYSLFEDKDIIVPAPGSKSGFSSAEDGSDDECTQYDNYNEVVIKDGSVYVSDASCKNQVCVKHGPITRSGETIVCLPNRLVVRIENSDGGGYDAVTS